MTTAEKLAMLKSLIPITDTTQDTLLGAYLTFAKNEIISWRYRFATYPDIAKAVNSEDNAITVAVSVFVTALSPTSGNSYVFTYSDSAESWQYLTASVDLANYGIGYDATPFDAETITVAYNESFLAVYDMTQIMSCVVGYNLNGAENQTAHGENGISRSFRYSDMIDYIRAHVIPFCGV